MNGEQIASAQNIQIIPTLANENLEPNGTQRINHNRGDDCCANGVGSKAQELIDRVPPCMGKFYEMLNLHILLPFLCTTKTSCIAQVKSKRQNIWRLEMLAQARPEKK